MTHQTHESIKSFPAHERAAHACAAMLSAAGIAAVVDTHPDTGSDWLHVFVKPSKAAKARPFVEAFCAGAAYQGNERIRSSAPELDVPSFWFDGALVTY